jgi:hypothetical protein
VIVCWGRTWKGQAGARGVVNGRGMLEVAVGEVDRHGKPEVVGVVEVVISAEISSVS